MPEEPEIRVNADQIAGLVGKIIYRFRYSADASKVFKGIEKFQLPARITRITSYGKKLLIYSRPLSANKRKEEKRDNNESTVTTSSSENEDENNEDEDEDGITPSPMTNTTNNSDEDEEDGNDEKEKNEDKEERNQKIPLKPTFSLISNSGEQLLVTGFGMEGKLFSTRKDYTVYRLCYADDIITRHSLTLNEEDKVRVEEDKVKEEKEMKRIKDEKTRKSPAILLGADTLYYVNHRVKVGVGIELLATPQAQRKFFAKLAAWDPLCSETIITKKEFIKRWRRGKASESGRETKPTTRKICVTLLDQNYLIAGIGNYLRAEILYRARIYPGKASNLLTDDELGRLYTETIAVMQEAYRAGGTTIATYSSLNGKRGEYKLRCYGKKKDPHGNLVVKHGDSNKAFEKYLKDLKTKQVARTKRKQGKEGEDEESEEDEVAEESNGKTKARTIWWCPAVQPPEMKKGKEQQKRK